MKDTKPLAVIILNWNGRKLLEQFLPSVVENTDYNITRLIVADNGSTDDSVAYIEQHFPAVEIMRFEQNHGFAKGYNLALEAVDNEYVVLLNSDVATTPGWGTELYAFMESHPDVGACQPKILSYNNPDTFEYAGAAGGFIDRDGYPYCRGRIFGVCEKDAGQYDEPMEVMWASGAALMVRRELYLSCGGLDPDFFAHMEEIDLCWRMRLAGYRIYADPAAVIYHLGGGSLPAENPRKTYLNFRNNLLMLHKNLPDGCRKSFLIRRRLLDTIAWAKYVATLDWKNAAAIVRAHRDFTKMSKAYNSHPKENILAQNPYSRLSILAAHYMRGRSRFSELKAMDNSQN